MSKIDQFESAFKAADKPAFVMEPIRLERVLVVTDLQSGAEEYAAQVRRLAPLRQEVQWRTVRGPEYQDVAGLLGIVEQVKPDLIVLYRNLHAPSREYPYSLGTYVDVLTQATSIPVLLTPHPLRLAEQELRTARCVMAITDHLAGDNHLVSYAAMMTADEGRLLLAHVEDERVFRRYMDVISKLPSIDTDAARRAIGEQLLKEPRDFIQSCARVLEQSRANLRIASVVALGELLPAYRRLIEEHDVDLLVLNTKDDDQLAMHGVAYPLTVELRETPMLLL